MKKLLWCFSLAFMIHAPALADEPTPGMPIEVMLFQEIPMVVSATLKHQKQSDAPAAITVVSAKEIKQHGYRTLKDLMNDIVGWVDVSDSNENITAVRGVYTSTTNKILILINGHRMNDLSLGRWNTDQFLGMDVVDRVEFIRGPASVLYGTGALIGVVNIITKKGADLDGLYLRPEIRLYKEGGKDYVANLTWGKKFEDLDVLLNFTYLNGEGAEIPQDASLDVAPSGQRQQAGKLYWNKYPYNYSMFAGVSYQDLSIDLRKDHTDRAVPRANHSAGGGFYDWYSEPIKPDYNEDTFYINLKYLHRLTDKQSITVNPSFHDFVLHEYTWLNPWGANRVPPLGTRGGQVSEEQHTQIKLYYENQLLDNLNIMAGVDSLMANFISSYTVGNPAAADPNYGRIIQLIPDRHDSGLWLLTGVLGQVIYSPLSNLEFTLSGRFDAFQGVAKPRFTPRAGVVYKPLDGLVAKLLYGQAYLSPEWDHIKSSTAGNAFLSNPNLKPEDFEGYDLILEWSWQNLRANLNLFKDRTQGLISSDKAGGISTYSNLGERNFQGGELELKYQPVKMAQVKASYSYVRNSGGTTENALLDNQIVGYPDSVIRYGLEVIPLENATVNLEGRTYAKVRFADPLKNSTEIPGWTTVDVTATYAIAALDLMVGVFNVADQSYELGGTVPRPMARPGRSVQASIGYKF